MEASPSMSISMLTFVGTAVIARRCVQLARRSITSPPTSLADSFSLTSDQVESLRSQHMSNSCSVSYKNTGPLHIRGGKKARLIDVNGVEYLDTRNNVAHCGHNHPEIVRAITYQMEQLNVRYYISLS